MYLIRGVWGQSRVLAGKHRLWITLNIVGSEVMSLKFKKEVETRDTNLKLSPQRWCLKPWSCNYTESEQREREMAYNSVIANFVPVHILRMMSDTCAVSVIKSIEFASASNPLLNNEHLCHDTVLVVQRLSERFTGFYHNYSF